MFENNSQLYYKLRIRTLGNLRGFKDQGNKKDCISTFKSLYEPVCKAFCRYRSFGYRVLRSLSKKKALPTKP